MPATSSPKKRRFFFRKTRELGEKEWEFGLKTNPFRRFLGARKRLALLQSIHGRQERARQLWSSTIQPFARRAGFSPIIFFQPRSYLEGTLAHRVMDTIGTYSRTTVPNTIEDTMYHFEASGKKIELGKMRLEYDAHQRKMSIQITLNQRGKLECANDFPLTKWNYERDLHGGSGTYLWEHTIPEDIVQHAIEWRETSLRGQMDWGHYSRVYGKSSPARKRTS